MRFLDFLSRVQTLEPDAARAWMRDRDDADYTLLDVRQPQEYERGHLPGAVLIPLPDLEERFTELPADKPVLAY